MRGLKNRRSRREAVGDTTPVRCHYSAPNEAREQDERRQKEGLANRDQREAHPIQDASSRGRAIPNLQL